MEPQNAYGCPICGATGDDSCMTSTGTPTYAHASRATKPKRHEPSGYRVEATLRHTEDPERPEHAIVAWVRKHPGIQTASLAVEVGITTNHIHVLIHRMREAKILAPRDPARFGRVFLGVEGE